MKGMIRPMYVVVTYVINQAAQGLETRQHRKEIHVDFFAAFMLC